MESNTQELVTLYENLGAKTDGNGTPILSVVQTSVTKVTTFLRERKFDPTTGSEEGPLDHEIDVDALATSADEVQEDLDTISTLQGLVSQITATPAQPIQIKVAQPAGKSQVGG